MKFRLKFVLLITLIFIISGIAQTQAANRLFGKIYFNITSFNITSTDSNSIIIPYRDFKIEILEVTENQAESAKILFTTYSDSNGYFTFKDIPENRYILRISHFKMDEKWLIDEIVSEKPINISYNSTGKAWIKPIGIDILVGQDNDEKEMEESGQSKNN